MKAMILSAGRGSRLRPLTDHTPKVMIEIEGKPLIQHHIEKLRACGVTDIVVNLAHLGEKIVQYLGDGRHLGVKISYSKEPTGGLETGGGLAQALPLLGQHEFIAINGDVYSDFDYGKLPPINNQLAHLALVPNPVHNPMGDFSLDERGLLSQKREDHYTFSGIAVYHPALFANTQPGKFSVVPLLKQAMLNHQVSAEVYRGDWHDIGTIERLNHVREA